MNAPIAVSCGDPSGIGPEIAAKAWETLKADVPFVWLGDPRHLPATAQHRIISDPEDALVVAATALPVLPVEFAAEAQPGKPNPANAKGVITAIETAVGLVQSGKASALCTAPIHKKALIDGAGFGFPGHTEFLADLAGRKNVVMMLASETLRVVPTTIHIALSDVKSHLTADLLEATIRITHEGLQHWFGISSPRLCIAGLNPHAGEEGAMGREEIELIAPLVDRMRREGFDLTGPKSADTMFHASARATYDVAIAMYHDQALIPIKTLAFDEGVNVTLGLPFFRTSPDHGTAYDIAGQNLARADSMIAALRMAADCAKRSG